MPDVSQQRELELVDAALLGRRVGPRQVHELAVHAAAHQVAVAAAALAREPQCGCLRKASRMAVLCAQERECLSEKGRAAVGRAACWSCREWRGLLLRTRA